MPHPVTARANNKRQSDDEVLTQFYRVHPKKSVSGSAIHEMTSMWNEEELLSHFLVECYILNTC